MSQLQTILLGVASSLAAAALFLLAFSRVRPKVDISPQIAKTKCTKGSGHCYVIKVINRSRRSAMDINVEFAAVESIIRAGGTLNRLVDFRLAKSSRFELPGIRKAKVPRSCFRFVTYDDIEAKWTDKSYLIVLLYAKDSLSGLGKVFKREYFTKAESLVEGSFAQDGTFTIA